MAEGPGDATKVVVRRVKKRVPAAADASSAAAAGDASESAAAPPEVQAVPEVQPAEPSAPPLDAAPRHLPGDASAPAEATAPSAAAAGPPLSFVVHVVLLALGVACVATFFPTFAVFHDGESSNASWKQLVEEWRANTTAPQ